MKAVSDRDRDENPGAFQKTSFVVKLIHQVVSQWRENQDELG